MYESWPPPRPLPRPTLEFDQPAARRDYVAAETAPPQPRVGMDQLDISKFNSGNPTDDRNGPAHVKMMRHWMDTQGDRTAQYTEYGVLRAPFARNWQVPLRFGLIAF